MADPLFRKLDCCTAMPEIRFILTPLRVESKPFGSDWAAG
jgi:hypothetical protein